MATVIGASAFALSHALPASPGVVGSATPVATSTVSASSPQAQSEATATSPHADTAPAQQPATSFVPEADVTTVTHATRPTAVSAESMLDHASGRIQEVDGQILGMYGQLDNRRIQSGLMSSDMQALGEIQKALSAAGKSGSKSIKLSELTVQLPGGSQNALEYINEHNLASHLQMGTPTGETKVSCDLIQQAVDGIRGQQSQLNSRTEQDMLQLQELVHQRGQVIELTTKMLEAMHQSQKAILANLGR